MMRSKQKGNIVEVECMLGLLKLGYNVLSPYGDCERYDFVVDIDNKFYRIQVKKANDAHIEEGFISFETSNKTTRNGKNVRHAYTKEEIDFFMTCYQGQCYLIPVQECSKTEKRLRFIPPKNGQIKGITFAQEYELDKVVRKITKE